MCGCRRFWQTIPLRLSLQQFRVIRITVNSIINITIIVDLSCLFYLLLFAV